MRLPREVVKASQRERLLSAIVELADGEGAPAVTVAALTQRAHVSRAAFYELFDGLEDCLMDAYYAQAARMSAWVVSAYNAPGLDEDERLRAANEAFANMVRSSPAAARVCIGEILSAGPRAREVQEQTVAWARRAMRSAGSPNGSRRAQTPLCRATALVGGARRALYDELRHDGAEDLSAVTRHLLEWARECSGAPEMPSGEAGKPPSRRERPADGAQEPPSKGRRQAAGAEDPASRGKRPADGAEEPPSRGERAGDDAQEPPQPEEEPNHDDARSRILDAVIALAGRRGYREMTHRDIAVRARVSYNTFYKHFASKEEAFLCACKEAHQRAMKPAHKALDQAPDWPQGLCAAVDAYVAELVSDGDCTRAGAIEVLSLGRPGLTYLDGCAVNLEELVRPGMELRTDVPASLVKGLAGSIEETVRHYTAKRILHRLPSAVPELSRVLLTPFLGVPQAMEVSREALEV